MKVPFYQHSKFLISVHFDNGFLPDTLDGKNDLCLNLLNDLAKLARSKGRKLHATYSIASGKNGYHAHFGVSWLPLAHGYKKTSKTGNKRIAKMKVIDLLEQSFFFVDNKSEAIKRIISDKKYVTEYIIYQPKDGQSSIFSDIFIYQDFVPSASEIKIQSYCSKHQFAHLQKIDKTGCINKSIAILYMVSIGLFMISIILSSLF